MIISKFIFN